jgi:hypothetical protein
MLLAVQIPILAAAVVAAYVPSRRAARLPAILVIRSL